MKGLPRLCLLLISGMGLAVGFSGYQKLPVQKWSQSFPERVAVASRDSSIGVVETNRCFPEIREAAVRSACLQAMPVPQVKGDIQNGDTDIQLVRQWAEADPSAAAIWATQQEDPAFRQEVLSQVALAWAERDLAHALAWAIELPADKARARVLQNLGYELARTDPAKALELAVTLPPEMGRDDLVIHAVSQWVDIDPVAATEWACAVSELVLRERILAAIATVMADQNPELAVTIATQALWPGRAQDQAAIAIVQRWNQQDPYGAADWVNQFPAGELQQTALDNLVATK